MLTRASNLSRFKDLRSNRLFRGAGIMTIATLATGLMGYAYQVLIGRMLSPAEFALFSAVMAFWMFFGSPLGAMLMLVSRRVSNLCARDHSEVLIDLYKKSHAYLAVGGVVSISVLALFAPTVQLYLKSPDQSPVWQFGLLLVLSPFLIINNAFFQGLKNFIQLGATGFVGVLIKMGISAWLIFLGFGVSGALGGVVLSTLLVWIYGVIRISGRLPRNNIPHSSLIEPFPIASIMPVLIANIAFVAMTQLDMVLVNYYFAPDQAGLYAAASVLGKAVLYLPGGLVFALFPLVAENHAKNKASAHLLLQAVAATATCCGLAALFYWIFGEWLIHVLYGPAYAGAGELLRWYGLAILPMTLVMVAEYFLIAQGKVLFAWLFLAMAPLQVLVIHLWHAETWMVVLTLGVCGTLLMSVGYILLWSEYRRASRLVVSEAK
jgi:O-antigen/teichoic acid export membrane protein